MKVYYKQNTSLVGEVTKVYVTDFGQKRMTVQLEYGTIDADVSEFQLI